MCSNLSVEFKILVDLTVQMLTSAKLSNLLQNLLYVALLVWFLFDGRFSFKVVDVWRRCWVFFRGLGFSFGG